ncbi:MAG: VOC family protein [Gemmatimonadaceae bacterium]
MPSESEPRSPVYPVLFYKDAPAMMEWLTRAFGIEKRMAMANPDGTILHSEMSFGAAVIMVSSSRADRSWRSPIELGGASASLCFYVADPDAHHARAVAAGAEIVYPLKDTDYGSRDYTARDPEGTSWTFGTYVPGAYWDKTDA